MGRDFAKLARKLSSQFGVKIDKEKLAKLVETLELLNQVQVWICYSFLYGNSESELYALVENLPPRRNSTRSEKTSVNTTANSSPTLLVGTTPSDEDDEIPIGEFLIPLPYDAEGLITILEVQEETGQSSQEIESVLTQPPEINGHKSEETGNSPLTSREWQIMDLLIEGCSNKQIADTLLISANTAKVHIRNIFPKLGARNRQHAVSLAVKFKLEKLSRQSLESSEINDEEPKPTEVIPLGSIIEVRLRKNGNRASGGFNHSRFTESELKIIEWGFLWSRDLNPKRLANNSNIGLSDLPKVLASALEKLYYLLSLDETDIANLQLTSKERRLLEDWRNEYEDTTLKDVFEHIRREGDIELNFSPI